VKRGARIVLFTLGGFVVLGLSGLFFLLGVPLIKGQLLEREFLSHDLNQKIVARNSNWSHDLRVVDVTDLFKSGTKKGEVQSELRKIGYKCGPENSSMTTLYCDQEAGYDFVCRKTMRLGATYNSLGVVNSIAAHFNLTCL
jgi:hypothetical protein